MVIIHVTWLSHCRVSLPLLQVQNGGHAVKRLIYRGCFSLNNIINFTRTQLNASGKDKYPANGAFQGALLVN